MALIFTCVAIYHFGGELSYRWGERRLRRFAIELVLAAGVVTCLLDASFHHGIAVGSRRGDQDRTSGTRCLSSGPGPGSETQDCP